MALPSAPGGELGPLHRASAEWKEEKHLSWAAHGMGAWGSRHIFLIRERQHKKGEGGDWALFSCCFVQFLPLRPSHPTLGHADLNYQQAVTSHVSSYLWGKEARERLEVSVPCYSPWKMEIKCAKGSKCPSHVHWPEDGVVEETVLILDVANPPYSWGCRGKGFGQESHPDLHFDTMSQPPWLWGRNEENNHYCVIPSCWGATKKQSYGLSSSTE